MNLIESTNIRKISLFLIKTKKYFIFDELYFFNIEFVEAGGFDVNNN